MSPRKTFLVVFGAVFAALLAFGAVAIAVDRIVLQPPPQPATSAR